MNVINQKTAHMKTFVKKTRKWYENYLTRKEFLGNLMKDFTRHVYQVQTTLHDMSNKMILQLGEDAVEWSRRIQALKENVEGMVEVVKLGNSFY